MNTEIEARLREYDQHKVCPNLVQALRRAVEVSDEYVPVDIMFGLEADIARILSAPNDKECCK